MYEIHVNYISILVAAVVSFFIGAVWYSPLLFGKQWIKAAGKTIEDIKGGAGTHSYLISFVAWLIASYILAVFIDYGVDLNSSPQFLFGALAGFMCWFGFVAATSLIHNLFAQRSIALWLIDSGYTLVAFLISGIILAELR